MVLEETKASSLLETGYSILQGGLAQWREVASARGTLGIYRGNEVNPKGVGDET